MPAAPIKLTERKRQAIVDAAVEEFRLAGFEGTSMDRIAANAGVSKRTVYNHFPSKELLFSEILEQLWESSLSKVGEPYRADVPLDQQLSRLLMQKLELLADPSFIDLARVAMAEIIRSPDRARDIVCRMGQKEGGVLAWLRAAAADDDRLDVPDPEFAAQQLEGLVKGFAFWPQVTMAQPPLAAAEGKRVVDGAVAMFLAHYLRKG